jgi:membrane-associated phospholipid phosphatase
MVFIRSSSRARAERVRGDLSNFLTPRVLAVLGLILAAAIVLAFFFARHDLALSEAAQALPGSHADYSFWWLINYYGEAPTWTIVILAALAYLVSFVSGRPAKSMARFRPHLLYLLSTAALAPGLINQGLKALVNRPRPGDGLGFLPLFKIGPAAHDNGFPSGHTAAAFVLLALAFLVPRSKPLLRALAGTGFIVWGIAVGVARVVYGVHYPSDVLFGALVTLSVEIILWGAAFRRRIAAAPTTPLNLT